VITVAWQQIPLGRAAAGRDLDVWVTNEVIQVFDGDELLRTTLRTSTGEIRKKNASIPGGRSKVQASVTPQPN